ncbi:MAG TPA: hypothetical protein VIV58_18570 [Kofleriaceae bacterium]
MSDNPYIKRYPSPTGAHAIVTVDNEVKMSHWISEPTLVDANDHALLEFGSSWSAERIAWLDAGRVEIAMRHYPGDRDAVVTIEIAARQVTLADGRVLGFDAFRTWLR